MATGKEDIPCASSTLMPSGIHLSLLWTHLSILVTVMSTLPRVMAPQGQSRDPGKELKTLVTSRLPASHTVTELSPVLI